MLTWKCYLCGIENPFHQTTCQNCPSRRRVRKGLHTTTCQLCDRQTILPLIQIVKDRGTSARWGIRSLALKHIPREYRGKLKIGQWVCFRCANPNMVLAHENGPRLCIYCNTPLRSTNPNMWCDACHSSTGASKECPGCGERLSRLEHIWCRKCAAKQPWPKRTVYYKPKSTEGVLNSSRPMKPGPGGIKSRNRAGLSLIEVKEELSLQISRREGQRNVMVVNQQWMQGVHDDKMRSARYLEHHGRPGEAVVLENEAGQYLESVKSLQFEIDQVETEIAELKDAHQAAVEVGCYRVHIPGMYSAPKRKEDIKRSTSWAPLMPPSEEDIPARPLTSAPRVVTDDERQRELCREAQQRLDAHVAPVVDDGPPVGSPAFAEKADRVLRGIHRCAAYFRVTGSSYMARVFCVDDRPMVSVADIEGVEITFVREKSQYMELSVLWWILDPVSQARWQESAAHYGYEFSRGAVWKDGARLSMKPREFAKAIGRSSVFPPDFPPIWNKNR